MIFVPFEAVIGMLCVFANMLVQYHSPESIGLFLLTTRGSWHISRQTDRFFTGKADIQATSVFSTRDRSSFSESYKPLKVVVINLYYVIFLVHNGHGTSIDFRHGLVYTQGRMFNLFLSNMAFLTCVVELFLLLGNLSCLFINLIIYSSNFRVVYFLVHCLFVSLII
jgi:hypothetical protein